MSDMSTCPRTDRLLRLLGDDLPEIEQTELIAHLETCPDCRVALDRLAAQSGLWNDLALLRDNPLGPPTGDLSKGPEAGPPDEEDIPVGLLEPSDDPGHLGKLGPYDILRLIGRGGMGIVFLARDQALDRLVAIKLLTPGMAATGAARRRFSREARAAAAVVHDHVVTIHAVDTLPQGVPYLVMQYVAGKSVQELIDRGKAPELAEILRIGSQAAMALAAAHAQGLIHRDIKPANILLENGVERVKITDFGLARAVDDATMTQSGVVAGTPQYMSPEQARSEPIDHRTDLFSLGSVLYALCTGEAPFRGSSSMATLKRVCEQTPKPIQSLNPEIPSWLVKIIDRLHAKDPANRYGSAADVADLLGRCLAHVQQPAGVPLPSELLPARSRRALALWGAIPACLLLAALLGFPAAREAAAQAASYVATVLRLKTPEGILVVETDDPSIGIKLDGSELVVTGAGVKELRLSVGEHKLQTIKDGKILRDELVSISRGGRTVLTVRREVDNPQPPPTALGLTDAPWPVRREEWKQAQAGQQSQQGPVLPKAKLVLESLGSEVRSVCFSPDGRDFAFGTKEGLIGITGWRFKPVGGPSATFKAHPGGVESVAFSPDGKTLVSGGWDHHVKLWDIAADPSSPRLLWDFAGFSDGVRSVAFSLGGDQVVAGGFDKVAIVLNAKDGLRIWTSPALEQPINGVQFSPDGLLLAMAMGDYSKGTPGNPVGQPGEVQVWSWPGRRRIATLRGWTRECKSVAFSPDSRLLAATSGDGTVRLYEKNRNTFDEKAVLQGGPWTAGVAFRPDSMQFANSNWSGQVLIWSLNGPKVVTSFQAHDQNIPCIAFSPDGRYLATASADGSVKVWDVSEPPAAPIVERTSVTASAAEQVSRMADALKRDSPRPSLTRGTGMRLYMRDLVHGRTTQIADPTSFGVPFVEHPDWSHDGRRIVFHIQPRKNDWTQSRLVMIESPEGRTEFRHLGAGCCPSFSPDDQTIAFLLLAGEVPGEEEGVWLMNSDGTNRRRVCESGAPFWSPDGTELLVNSWFEPTETKVYSFATKRTSGINVPGQKIFSWPRWAGPHTLVACVGGDKEPDSIVLLDVSRPSEARVTSTLWNRSTGPDVYARWPLVSPSTGDYFFIGDEGSKRTLYALSPGGGRRGRLSALEVGGPKLSGLSVSPDGRFLLFDADWIGSETSSRLPESTRNDPTSEVERLAGLLKRNPPRPSTPDGTRMQLYLRDLQDRGTTVIADEPVAGLTRTSSPCWSNDGRRIAFHATPQNDWGLSRLLVLRALDGKPVIEDLGHGSSPAFGPGDESIAFLVWPGPGTGERPGVWIMRSDGTERRRLTDPGAPFWSPDGEWIMINHFGDPTECRLRHLATGKEESVRVAGHQLWSWPRWVGPDRIVAVIRKGEDDAAIALLDVTKPAAAEVVKILWTRGPALDVLPRWPLFRTTTGETLFVGVTSPNFRNLYRLSANSGGRAEPLQDRPLQDQLEGLFLSPGERYLLFNANRPDREVPPKGTPVSIRHDPAGEALWLAEPRSGS